jgi:hypothetical protein
MLKTAIILGLDGNFPIWHKNDGLAKSESIAKWIFKFCGWETNKTFPNLAICEETIEANDLDVFTTCDTTKLFVLGSPLILN